MRFLSLDALKSYNIRLESLLITTYYVPMEKLRSIIEDTDTKSGRVFDLVVQALIVISLISFSIETLPDLESSTRQLLRWVEVSCVVVFTLEYFLRIAVAKNKRGFIFSFFGIVDLIAVLPFYLALGIDLRSVRAFRLLRLLRLLKLTRYSEAMRTLTLAIRLVREELILFFIVSLIVLYLTAVGIYYFENPAQPEKFSSIFSSMWWSVATLTAVGYGDIYPITVGGKVFTFFILLVGLGIVSVPAGILASALSEAKNLNQKSKDAERD